MNSVSQIMAQDLTNKEQITLIKQGEIVAIKLPSQNKQESNRLQWQRIIDNFKVRLRKIERSWQVGTKVQINSQDRLLDTRQLNELENILEKVGLVVELIITRRRQTAVAAASSGYSVQQESPLVQTSSSFEDSFNQDLAEPLYLKNTIRSGVEIYHPSTIIIMGDVNPGATIIAHGDILICGNLKGVAHAGAAGNYEAVIMALKMQPTQIRIADLVARAPSQPPEQYITEIAYVSSEGIKIHVASNFYRYHEFLKQTNYWQAKNQGKFKLKNA